MKTWILVITCVLLNSCATVQPKHKLVNGCLIEAIEFQASLDAKAKLTNSQVWSKVLIVGYKRDGGEQIKGHAYCVYLYPPGRNQLWAYDYESSSKRITTQRVIEWINNPRGIAEKIMENQAVEVTYASYLE